MRKIKGVRPMKKVVPFIIFATLLMIFLVVEHFSYGFFMRRSLKHKCGVGMDCVCFANVVDNRLSRAQVRAFSKLLDSVRVRANTNILEFTDQENAHKISELVSICRRDKQ